MFLIIDLPPDVLKIDWTDNLRRNLLFWNRFEAQNQSEFTLPPNAVLIMFCCWPFIQTIIHDKIKSFTQKISRTNSEWDCLRTFPICGDKIRVYFQPKRSTFLVFREQRLLKCLGLVPAGPKYIENRRFQTSGAPVEPKSTRSRPPRQTISAFMLRFWRVPDILFIKTISPCSSKVWENRLKRVPKWSSEHCRITNVFLALFILKICFGGRWFDWLVGFQFLKCQNLHDLNS